MSVNTQQQPLLRAVPMGLFPQMNTLQEVIDLGETKLPIHNKNDLVSLIMCYHNTLLKVANDQPKQSNQPN